MPEATRRRVILLTESSNYSFKFTLAATCGGEIALASTSIQIPCGLKYPYQRGV